MMKRFLLLLLLLLPSLALAESFPEFEPSGEGIYNYCPAAFEEGGVRHMYYCTNTAVDVPGT